MKQGRKKAFTLTELLVVVVIVGILSAVALPKFNRAIETRKTGEAEEMMSAVRTEQEKRCTLDQNYTMKPEKLQNILLAENTKNYTYSLQEQGISAVSANGAYTLKIVSYKDGRFCCEGDGCEKLNKNYPDCAGMTVEPSDCVGEDAEPEPELPVPAPECMDGQTRGSQSCNGCGTQTTQLCAGGSWVNSPGACSKTAEECNPSECTEGETSGSQPCNTCGTQSTKQCVGGKWKDVLGACSKEESECEEDCCSYSAGSSEAQACFKKKSGENSLAYICSNYGNKTACLKSLYQGGSQLTYRCRLGTNESDLQGDKNGYSGCQDCRYGRNTSANKAAYAFFNGGFLNYGCDSTIPQCDTIKYEASDNPVWKSSDRSGYMQRSGSCSNYDASALVKSVCGGSDPCNGTARQSWVGQTTDKYPVGTNCTTNCSSGGKIYPKGTIGNWEPDDSKRPQSGPYQDVSCSGGACNQICIIPYTYKIVYAAKQ